MTTAFKELLAAVVAVLDAAPPIAGEVQRQKNKPEPRERSSAINVRLVRTRKVSEEQIGGPADWLTLIAVECAYRAAAGDEVPLDGADPLLEAAYARLIAPGALLAVGVMNVQIETEIEWDDEDGVTPLASAFFTVAISHRTQGSSLLAQP